MLLTLPGADPNEPKIHVFNLNNVAPKKSYEDVSEGLDTESDRKSLPDGRIRVGIVDKPNAKEPSVSHLGPGPYMVVASSPADAKVGGQARTLFYYYETYNANLSECAMYRDH